MTINNNILKIFFIYLDKTNDNKVFYVGKGMEKRIKKKIRNKYWNNIKNKYGHHREIIFATKDEQFAFKIEKKFILEYKTFEADWPKGEGFGANFTRGGEGSSGIIHSRESNEKRRSALKGEKSFWYGKTGNKHPVYGTKKTDVQKQAISKANNGENHPLYGVSPSAETRRKSSISNSGKIMSVEARKKISESRLGEKHHLSKLELQQVIEIREKYNTGNYTQLQLGIEYNVSRSCIAGIIQNINWKV